MAEFPRAKFVGKDQGPAAPGTIELRSVADARRVVEHHMMTLLDGKDPPNSLQGLSALTLRAVSCVTATMLQSAAAAAHEDGVAPELAAASMGFAMSLVCDAGAELLTESVENLVSARSAGFSSN